MRCDQQPTEDTAAMHEPKFDDGGPAHPYALTRARGDGVNVFTEGPGMTLHDSHTEAIVAGIIRDWCGTPMDEAEAEQIVSKAREIASEMIRQKREAERA